MTDLPEPVERLDATHIRWRKLTLTYFGGCDYHRLNRHPLVLRAAERAGRRWGLNVAASRMTTGNHPLYLELERALARFFRAESATLVAGGYVTNLIVAQALAGEFTHVLLDAHAHPSLADAARFFDARITRFPHADAEALKRVVTKLPKSSRAILLTDGMFASDGSVAPLREYLRILPSSAWLLVDDAHGAGVVGATGRGSLEHAGVSRARIVQTITLSKAFGAYGGAILGTHSLRERIVERSRMFVGSTPPPLPPIAAALESIRLFGASPSLIARARRNVQFVRHALDQAGISAPDTPGPIVSITPRTATHAARLRQSLLARDILPPFLNYPGTPPQGCFRFVISGAHNRTELAAMVGAVIAGGSARRV
ncbi:MAG TPA: pyridoxal phosphate-dependent aminotransferase family protein [Verrucomicrobiae bacterium]|jgi:7-keto-8-aminopelargonate synthetase-like enzyme